MHLGDPERERIFEALSRHTAAGHLELDELERRVAVVAAAQTVDEARKVLADLPALEPSPGAAPETDRRRPGFRRGHGDAPRAGADWTPTAERFRDPRTQRVMRVWEDPQGGRHYVAED